MQSARFKRLVMLGVCLLLSMGFARLAPGGRPSPACIGASDCALDSLVCTFPDTTASLGPTVISDFSDGVSSDGRGPYVEGTDGVRGSSVAGHAGLGFIANTPSIKNPRKFIVNLNHPVPGGGGAPLGVITTDGIAALHAQWYRLGTAVQNLHSIPVGQTVTAAQMNVSFFIDGRWHILQMGPQPNGHCHSGINLVNGAGTSSGTIHRTSQTKWVMELPSGSLGRLFDAQDDNDHAVDKGLYYVHLRYAIGR